ncbi:MAG TPA: hypothetical protein VFQ53_10770 [Kofleriaceae bacterium]|nr:hypothetical protein [Kofleriaceae bacterium]
MRRALRNPTIVLWLIAAGCGSSATTPPDAVAVDAALPDAEVAPAFRNPVALPDDELARQALQLLGGNVSGARESCNQCHGMTRQSLAYWRALSDQSMTRCLTDLAVSTPASARQMIDCLRAMPEVAGSDYSTERLGVYATATRLPWFQYTMRKAYGADADAELATLETMVGMPRGGAVPAFTQGEFDIVAEWFARGLPLLEQTLPEDPRPSQCQAGISAEVGAHVAAMKTQGWRAINRSNLLAMHGCGAATDPRDCLADVPLATDQPFGGGWDVAGAGKLRVLANVDYSTSYWTRSSPDGRFIGHGVRNVPGSYIYDLQRATTVSISAVYDPGWFPDNTGFVFQGGPRNVCAQSVLTSNPSAISMTEPGCSDIQTIGLYQHVGRAIGGDYFAIDSRFVSDDGGHEPTLDDPAAHFDSTAHLSFIPMIFDGAKYVPKPQVTIRTRFEGDTVLSPSARVVMTRVSGAADRQLGYVLRKVNATPSGGSYTITAPEIARYCVAGGKPAFSYDERWVVFHHYVTAADAVELGFSGPDDPAFQPYLASGAANVYLLELATGAKRRITNMQPGQYALFPHFRSDGWIYLQVRDAKAGREYMVASDAALIAEL